MGAKRLDLGWWLVSHGSPGDKESIEEMVTDERDRL